MAVHHTVCVCAVCVCVHAHVSAYMHVMSTVYSCKVNVTQSRPTLCDPMDCTVHGMLQARILGWVAFPFSRDLPNPEIKPRSHIVQVDFLPAEPQ